uniref:Uncharacterized protein n=1 Tax=Oryza meridionalis TaxID=40149 RepID=A0A0E0D1L5_9ORYZ
MPFVSSCLQIFSASPLLPHGLALPLPFAVLVSFPHHYAAMVSKLLSSSESNERAPNDDGP